MGDEQDRAGKRVERGLERLATLEVEMVRRLVEQEQVRARGDDEREREPPALAAREHRDGPLMHLPAREEEPAEEVLRLWTLKPRGVLCDRKHRPALVELDLVLREVRRLDAVAEPQLSGDGLPAAEECLQQRCLARAVRPDERDVLSPLDRERDVCEELLVACGERDALGLHDRTAAPLRLKELEAQALRPAREQRDLPAELGPLLLEATDVRQLRLGSLREALLVAEALDEALEAGDVDVDPARSRRGCSQPCRLLAAPVVPGPGEVGRASGFELEAQRSSPPRGTSGRGRRGRRRRRSTVARVPAIRGSPRRGGWWARRGAGDQDRRRARGRARRASAHRPRRWRAGARARPTRSRGCA